MHKLSFTITKTTVRYYNICCIDKILAKHKTSLKIEKFISYIERIHRKKNNQ